MLECEYHIAIGISIKTFFLDKYFSCLFQDTKFEKYIGKICYVPPNKEDYPENYKTNSFVPFFMKRDDFKVEKEIRIVIQDMVSGDSFFSFNKYKVLDEEIVNGDPFRGIRVRIDLHKIDEFIISPAANSSIVEDIKLCINNAGLDISKIKIGEKPSDKALNETIEILKSLVKSNDKSLNGIENYKKSNILPEEYWHQGMKDASGNIIATAILPSNPSEALLRSSVDPSLNTVFCQINKSNDFSHKKVLQQCQSCERNTNIKLNR